MNEYSRLPEARLHFVNKRRLRSGMRQWAVDAGRADGRQGRQLGGRKRKKTGTCHLAGNRYTSISLDPDPFLIVMVLV